MKHFARLLLVAALALSAAGCAQLSRFNESVLTGGLSITATVQNPVTREQQAAVEGAYALAADAVLAYVRLPRCGPGEVTSVRNLCSKWSVVQKLMTANRAAYRSLVNLRTFMDNNQQVSAASAFNAAVGALRDLRAIAFVNGLKVDAPT